MNGKQEQPAPVEPYLGQRCAVVSPEWQGFGTIIALKDDQARVELDARGSHWFALDTLELLDTRPAT